MKKFAALLLICIFIPNTAVWAKNIRDTENSEENITMGGYSLDQSNEYYEEENSRDRLPDPYFKHVTGWEEIMPERIDALDLVFYLDSQELTKNIGAKIMPLNAKKDISYMSEDMSIAKVDANGNVTVFNKPGECEITITAGKIKKSVKVTVIRGVTGVKLSREDMLFYADRPISAQLEATVYPPDASNKKVTWSSDNTSVVSVDENGLVTPSGTGNANIIVKTADGGYTAKCKIYVEIYDIPVRGVFHTNAPEAIRINDAYKINTYIYPENARNKTLKWTSSNESVVRIDENGTMHGLSEGMSNITVTAENGVEDYFTVSVIPNDGGPFEYKIISEPYENKIRLLESNASYISYNTSMAEAVDSQMQAEPTVFTSNSSAASRSDVEKYINPSNYSSDTYKYQFLDLSKSNGISADTLNNYLKGKGVIEGKGGVFLQAAQDYGLSEIYLTVHACLESGGGTSRLSSGVEYNGKTVYNMFGIGAVDASPIQGGAKYAYEHEWFSVDSAIEGGAKWISENYINNVNYNQNTLYKMRWNPSKPGVHQYATDVAWAVKQAEIIKGMFDSFPEAELEFEVPVYMGEKETPLG